LILLVTRKLRARLHHVEEAPEIFYKDLLRAIMKTEEKKGGEKSNTEALKTI